MSRGPEQLRLTPDERANLVAYIDGELPDPVSRALSTKLTHSATARQEIEVLKRTWELLGHLPMPEVEAQFSERTIIEIRRLEVQGPQWGSSVQSASSWVIPIVAYVLMGGVALGVGYGATRWLWPDPSARLARDLSIAEHLDEYLDVGSYEFLRELVDAPEFRRPPP